MEVVLSFVIGYLSDRGVMITDQNYVGYCYYENNTLDSFELLALFTSIDQQFGVKLSPEEMLSDQLKTVDGLVSYIADRMS
jgi:hypothetical protein